MNILLKFLFVLGFSCVIAVALTPNITTGVFILGAVGLTLVWLSADNIIK
jgi:hypothetical protein